MTISAEARRSADGLETGGVLLGQASGDLIEIRHAGDPGPGATRGTHTFHRDLAHAQHLADAAWQRDRSVWIGEWHTHPSGDLTPSAVDLDSYLRHLHDTDLGFDLFVAMICGLGSGGVVTAAAWLVTRELLEPLEVRTTP